MTDIERGIFEDAIETCIVLERDNAILKFIAIVELLMITGLIAGGLRWIGVL